VIYQQGRGKGDAIGAALANTRTLDFRYVVFIDADFTYPAEFLPRMVGLLEKETGDGMVCGNRTAVEHSRLLDVQNLFTLGNRMLAFAHNIFNGVKLRDPLTGLRVVRWEVLRGWMPRSRGFDVEVEMNRCVEKKGYRIREIPIFYRERLGEKKLKLRHGFTILNRIVHESLRTD
jgi:dolichol-phosphate mannosyltransferase